MDRCEQRGEESRLAHLRGATWDEYNEADCSLDHEWRWPGCRGSLSSDRRHRRSPCGRPANARANGDPAFVPDQGCERGELAATRWIAHGGGTTTSRKMHAASARDRHTSRPPFRANTWWTSARRAGARARRPRRRLRDRQRGRPLRRGPIRDAKASFRSTRARAASTAQLTVVACQAG